MSNVVQSGPSGYLLPISEEVARAHNLREGVEVTWETTSEGRLVLAEKPRRDPLSLRGSLKQMLAPEGGGVEAFLEWRREDARSTLR